MARAALCQVHPPPEASDDDEVLPAALLRFIQALAEADEAEDYARQVAKAEAEQITRGARR